MKNLHKKISAVALIAVLVAPVLSQGFVAHANLNIRKVNVSSYDEFQNYRVVVGYEKDYYYDSLYLDSKSKPKKVDESYSDGREFLKRVKNDLHKYRRKRESIFIKVGKCYFEIFLHLSDKSSQRFDRTISNL